MRIPINLAREPFRKDRLVFVSSAVAGLVMLLSLVYLTAIGVSQRAESRKTRTELEVVNRQVAGMQAEQVRLDAQLRQPVNAIVLDRSLLINDIIRRKSISWTKIFSDLETVLPPNVRVSSIRPQVNAKDQLSLDMTVESETPEPVIAFIIRLEGSDVFGSVENSTGTPPTQNDPYYHYRLSVNYAQKL